MNILNGKKNLFHVLCCVLNEENKRLEKSKKTNKPGPGLPRPGGTLQSAAADGRLGLTLLFFLMFVSPPLHFSCLLQQRPVVRTGVGLSPSLVFPPIKEMTWTKGWKSYAEGGMKAAYDSGRHCHCFFF